MREVNSRSDARSNRDRILATAREALAVDPHASLHSIAKAAGVGQGTLYRHFQTREALVAGVYHEAIDSLVALAPGLLANHEPLQAFRLWCERFADYSRKKHGIADMVRAAVSEQHLAETYLKIVDAVGMLMNACVDTKAIGDPADPEDFLQLLALLVQLPATTEGIARSERLLTLVFRGMDAG